MRKVALILVALGLVALGATAAVASGAMTSPGGERIRLTPAGGAEFPQRSFRLGVPEQRNLHPEDIRVTENGDPVRKLELASAGGRRGGEFGAILVIDASKSMRGRAIRSAIGAARVLARRRSGSQQLGIIVFSRNSKVLLAPTDDQSAIDEVLARTPRLARGTRIFDAVDKALDLLRQARITAGSVVVLSDGSDSGSWATPEAVARRARKDKVTISTVGLRSGAFDGGELDRLAAAGRGRYIVADSPSDLRRIFRDLGAQFASDYLLSYRSLARPGREVTVTVRVGGIDGLATSTYFVPGGATFVQVKDSFWTGGTGVALTGVLGALLIALALWILLVRRGIGPSLRERVRGFVSMPGDAPARDTVLTGRTPGGAERSLERTQWWAGFKSDVEIARITANPVRIVTATALATLVVMFLFVKLSGFALVGVFALAIPWGVRTWVRIALERQRALFTEQLPDMLQGAASAIRAGQGLVAALAMVAEDAPEPARTEFLRLVADEALGVPLEEALRVVQERMDNREVLQIALVAQIQREAGGNMAEVLDRITETLRQRAELQRMVKALTAQGRLSRWVVTALPLVLLGVISVLNGQYVSPLFTTALGLVLLSLAGFMMFLGSLIIGKIVNFEV